MIPLTGGSRTLESVDSVTESGKSTVRARQMVSVEGPFFMGGVPSSVLHIQEVGIASSQVLWPVGTSSVPGGPVFPTRSFP